MNKQLLCTLALTWFMLFSTAVAADDFVWQGFAAQGLIRAADSSYVNNSGKTSAALTELGLNGRYRLAPDWHLAGQVVYLDGGNRYPQGGRLDYLFLDWALYNAADWQANMYFGRFKNQHWLYSETRDVPFTRPSIILPQSVYFDSFRDIAVGTDGVALQVRNSGNYGDLTFNWSFGTVPVSREQSRQLLGQQTRGDTRMNHDHKASLYWQSLQSRFSYGIVIQEATFDYRRGSTELLSNASFTSQRVMLTARYQSQYWQLSAELQQEVVTTEGFFLPQFTRKQFGQGGYVMLQYYWSADLRLFTTIDYAVIDKDDRHGKKLQQMTGGAIPSYFGYQHTLNVGSSIDLNQSWRLNAEVHWVKGAGRLAPVIQPDVARNNSEYWQVFALQLMYRF
ncbi:hypothetical protein [Rheinheimera sp.]|uniref:hypothetical protein n=1 Tax=Rheinheimera sp. TaxID=1869214 RepID=UPI0027357F48|nr:hypothetical protein [Rheinheimera sp.]MDP2714865.1 hypothetical protein [Rheinheimera sp.]